ncbi:glycoside hydrolase family 2 TIM barrel-domain containing protein [Hymenobacter sp. YC55]|uniref:glycoside hydrolase family 2 TIM barrel-domain containing protein n=1 Tax=Hymenobacter sp. YC55 TaxID=3034019 RepID=UPI0023F6294A|nr:glycoside hydrolase family 2 TIM barrel-domain containing protein [Hymenobacter sp. YC55]MDF7814784.1 glycoside hydrolase family 2 TIM barrel-domain containing protein [Hymenobacter sp. YC55]
MSKLLFSWSRRLQLGLLLLLAVPASAQRLVQSISSDWLFRKGEATTSSDGWEKVSLPHTWNATDVLDDEPGYYRGVGSYKKTLTVPADWQRRRVFLRFEGANQEAEVYVNGQLAGRHVGGYTAFSFPISKFLTFSGTKPTKAEVVVKLTNRYNPDIPPLTADFTFYGGLYRDVYLVAAEPVHFDLSNHASDGVFTTTPTVSATAAAVVVAGTLTNEAATTRRVTVQTQLLDRAGQLVARQQTRLNLKAGQAQAFRLALPSVRQPHLWTPDDPYLYRTVTQVLEGNTPLDEVSSPVGLRWFRFDAATGFFLNGQPLKLIGTNRHQDYPGLGNALPTALAERDVQLLKQMGGNFLRVSHYPHDPAVLAACDRLGILASVEIPIVNAITDSEAFFQNCRIMQTEMIRQNGNHPSVIIWAYMNEVLLRLPAGIKRDNEPGRAYLRRVATLARQLDSLTRHEDPARATMLVCHGDLNLYQQAGLTAIPQVIGWNLYPGWYSPDLQGFPDFLDRHRKELPDKPLLVTEYGADCDVRLHAAVPKRFDKSMEYANRYHEFYLKAILDRPFVAGCAVWNLAEFNSETRQEAVPHINNKSLLTGDRQPKDTYWFYQAHLLRTPVLRIGSRAWTLRAGPAAGPDSLYCRQLVEVYTNQPTVRLQLNGRDLGTKPAVFGVARFMVPFGNGLNQLRAQAPGQAIEDQTDIEFQLLPPRLASADQPFTEFNVSLGDERTFTDDRLHQVWVPEQPYTPGSWGYVGGHVYKLPGDRLPYGSDRDILGTDYDAIYETQRQGLKQFRLDVPDGQYEVTLHFAELEAVPATEQLAYNLAGEKAESGSAAPAARSFTVLLNGQPILPNLSTDAYLRPLQAASFKVPVTASGGKGIIIDFTAQAGEAFLNGLQVKRSY